MSHSAKYRNNGPISFSDRETMAQLYFDGLVALINVLKNGSKLQKLVLTVREYAVNSYGVGEPMLRDDGAPGLNKRSPLVGESVLVPLVESDAKLHPYFAAAISQNNVITDQKDIFILTKDYSQLRNGLLFYELIRFVMLAEGIPNNKIVEKLWEIRYEVLKEILEINRRIFGSNYSQLVQKYSKQFEKDFSISKSHPNFSTAATRNEMKRALGEKTSEDDLKFLRILLLLDASLNALDKLQKDGKSRAHIDQIRWFYETSVVESQ
jgi:hypothetical protein